MPGSSDGRSTDSKRRLVLLAVIYLKPVSAQES